MKCVQYWGKAENQPEEIGQCKVTMLSVEVFTDYVVRKIRLELKVRLEFKNAVSILHIPVLHITPIIQKPFYL